MIIETIDNSQLKEWQSPPVCEYTAPGSTTEGVDCWEPATRRHLGDDGMELLGVFCDEHSAEVAP